jgi:hypothetical protein
MILNIPMSDYLITFYMMNCQTDFMVHTVARRAETRVTFPINLQNSAYIDTQWGSDIYVPGSQVACSFNRI